MPCRRVFLSLGAPLANLKGVRLRGLLREKKFYIRVPFLDPKVITILCLGGHGSHDPIWGTKGPSIKA